MSATRARLRGVSRINFLDANPSFLSLIGQEGVELSKRPTMQASFGLAFLPDLTGAADMLQILNHQSRAGEAVGNNAPGEDMITIPVESHRLARQLSQVSTSRLCSLGLQGTTETKTAAIDFFPAPLAEELALRGDCRAIESQIDSDNLSNRGNVKLRDRDNHMQPVGALTVAQVCCGNLRTMRAGTERRNRKRDTLFASTCRETDTLSLPVEGVGFFIVANGTEPRTGLAHWTAFFLAIKGRGEGFGCFDTGLDEQITDQTRIAFFGGIVHGMMQADAILLVVLPTIDAHLIESGGKLRQCLIEGLRLLRGWV